MTANSFGLPDLQNRFIRGASTGSLGNQAGSETIQLQNDSIPAHTHTFSVADVIGSSPSPADHILHVPIGASPNPLMIYTNSPPDTSASIQLEEVGEALPFSIIPLYWAVEFHICADSFGCGSPCRIKFVFLFQLFFFLSFATLILFNRCGGKCVLSLEECVLSSCDELRPFEYIFFLFFCLVLHSKKVLFHLIL
jgi:hypothetical protein